MEITCFLFHILRQQIKNLSNPMFYSHFPYSFLNVISPQNSNIWEALF